MEIDGCKPRLVENTGGDKLGLKEARFFAGLDVDVCTWRFRFNGG